MSINKERVEEYARIKNQIKGLTTSAEIISEEILLGIQAEGVEEIEIQGVGKITLVSKRKYTYPKDLEEEEKNLKQAKKEAEATGEATYVENPYIIFKSNEPEQS